VLGVLSFVLARTDLVDGRRAALAFGVLSLPLGLPAVAYVRYSRHQ